MCFHSKVVLRTLLPFLILISSSATSPNESADFGRRSGEESTSLENTKHTVAHSHQISSSILPRNDNVGNVIFDDNMAYGGGSASSRDIRNGRVLSGAGGRVRIREVYSPNVVAGGYLKNHRLEEPFLPQAVTPSSTAEQQAAAVGAAISTFNENDLKLASDNSQQRFHSSANGLVTAAGASFSGTGQGRAYNLPRHGSGSSHGWASNSGSCLFSCSPGQFGGASCCQQNYVQCCPNPQHEQRNFKNLHHGRGYFGGGGGGGGNFKGGHAWGSVPYNPPPIISPKSCQPYPHPGLGAGIHAGGSLINKGIQTIHNIGQFFKGHVSSGWNSAGNGAAGYYFHRRADENVESSENHHEINSSKKKRPTRSVNNGWDRGGFGQVMPCPVYSAPPSFGWPPARPYSAGLGSLIGWTKPGIHVHNSIQGGGGGYCYASQYQYGNSGRYGWGNGGGGSNICRSDYECPGSLKCCKGVCQVAPYFK